MSDKDVSTSPPDATVSKPQYAYCPECGSERIAKDAWALFSVERQDWELGAIYDHTFCLECETETEIEWRENPLPRTERIARLNDMLRQGKGANGQWLITQGVQALGNETVKAVMKCVGSFDDFSKDNDPHAERDFGMIERDGQKFFFKIDYYDLNQDFGSEDPADPEKTKRVLTLMLVKEY